MKKTERALKQLVVGTIVLVASLGGIVGMYFSTDFLPVYDGGGNWHWFPQVVRYGLYAVLGMNAFFAAYAVYEAVKYLVRRYKKRYFR